MDHGVIVLIHLTLIAIPCGLLINSGDVCTNSTPVVDELEYCQVSIENIAESIVVLRDNGAQMSLIKHDLVRDLNLPKLGNLIVRGVIGQPEDAELVSLRIKPYPGEGFDNIAPYLDVIFAACDLTTDVDVILCRSVVNQLDDLNAYNVLKYTVNPSISVDAVTLDQ